MLPSPDTPDRFHCSLQGQLEEIPALAAALSQWAQASHIPARRIVGMNLLLDELITNIILHGYRGQPGWIEIESARVGERWTVVLRDHAPAFDPLQLPEPDTTLALDTRPIGGLGVFFVRRMSDELHYQRRAYGGQDANELTLVQRLDREPAS